MAMDDVRFDRVRLRLLRATKELREARALLLNNFDGEKRLVRDKEWMPLAKAVYLAQFQVARADEELGRLVRVIPKPKSP